MGWAVSRICLLCLSLPSAQWAVHLSCCPHLWSCAAWDGRGKGAAGIQLGCGRLGHYSLHWRGRLAAESLSFLFQEIVGLARSSPGPGQPWLREGLVVLAGYRDCQHWKARPTVQGLTGSRAASAQSHLRACMLCAAVHVGCRPGSPMCIGMHRSLRSK